MNTEKPVKKKIGKKAILFRALIVVIVVVFGALLVRKLLDQISIFDIKEAFFGMYRPTLIGAFAVLLIGNFFRAYRKDILVGSDHIGMGDMFLVSMIRNAFNMVLPARTGELSYIYVLTNRFKFPLEVGVSTLMVALIFDLAIVFSLIVIAIIIVGINAYSISSVSVILIAAALLIFSLLILFYIANIIDFVLIAYRKLLNRYNVRDNRLIYRIYKKLLDISKNLKIIRERKIYWKVYLSSIAIRVLKFTGYYLIIHAILSPIAMGGYKFSNLNFWEILLATAAAEISAVLPTHALAGFGTYEYAFAIPLMILGFSENTALITGFTYHLVVLLYTVILGIISIIIISMPFYRIKKNKLEENKL